MPYQTLCGNSVDLLKKIRQKADFAFLDPPFNQQKNYTLHNDDIPAEQYWAMMKEVCQSVFNLTKGGCIYFMQREKTQNLYCKCYEKQAGNFKI